MASSEGSSVSIEIPSSSATGRGDLQGVPDFVDSSSEASIQLADDESPRESRTLENGGLESSSEEEALVCSSENQGPSDGVPSSSRRAGVSASSRESLVQPSPTETEKSAASSESQVALTNQDREASGARSGGRSEVASAGLNLTLATTATPGHEGAGDFARGRQEEPASLKRPSPKGLRDSGAEAQQLAATESEERPSLHQSRSEKDAPSLRGQESVGAASSSQGLRVRGPLREGVSSEAAANFDRISESEEGVFVLEGKPREAFVFPWRLYLCAFVLKVAGGVALLGSVLSTLSVLGEAVACAKPREVCLNRGGILAYPVLLHETTGFSYGVSSYFATTTFLLLGLIGVLVPLWTSAYFSLQAMLQKTRPAFLASVHAVTWAAPPVGVFAMAFLGPVFFSEKFCSYEDLDLNAALRPTDSPIPLACERVCEAFPLTVVCFAIGVLCLGTVLLVLFQNYSALWAASLSASFFKVVSGGALLLLGIVFSVEGREIVLETFDLPRPESGGGEQKDGFSQGMQIQIALLFSTLQWGVYILATLNFGAGIFGFVGAYFRSHVFSLLNVLVNFSFLFINAACFCAMSFENASLQLACDYREYPLGASNRGQAEARMVCRIVPQFLVAWVMVFVLAVVNAADMALGVALFKHEICEEASKQQRPPRS